MKRFLLPETGNDYKANLHCHTTCSDGRQSPEEVKRVYRDMGYSIVAYTDHDILLDHSDLNDANFLALHGFEMEINDDKPTRFGCTKCLHVCLIAKEPDNLIQPCWHRSAYLFANAPKYRDQVRFDPDKPDFVRSYTGECFRAICDEAHKNGFFVTYNHPTWSMESYPDYIRYEGMDAMEYFNGSCLVAGFNDYNPRVYDDLLREGRRIFVVGADDNHHADPALGRSCDAGIAWTVIRADSLDYRTVTKALEAGNFYASNGPEIHALWMEDGKVHITCSPADRIKYSTAVRSCQIAAAPAGGDGVTEAVFSYSDQTGYFRIEVVDQRGRCAATNAYFCDSL